MPDTNLTPEQQRIVDAWRRNWTHFTTPEGCQYEIGALLSVIDDLDKRLTEAERNRKFRAAVLEWCKQLTDEADA